MKQLIVELPEKLGFEKVMELYIILNKYGQDYSYKFMASLTYETPQISKDPIFMK